MFLRKDDQPMDEKEKWKIVMNYMQENPSFLVDALPTTMIGGNYIQIGS